MNDKRVNQYLILPENGQRKDTKLAVEHSEEQIAELLKQGYVIVGNDDFNKLIGNGDGEYLIADDGVVYPKPAPTDAELLAVAKPAQIAELKAERDSKEVEPITYNGNSYDYDGKARPEAVVRQLLSVIIGYKRLARLLHPQLIIGQSFTADGYGAVFASFCF